MDVSIILPLLVALVPIALFFALVHRRRAPDRREAVASVKPAIPPASSEPPSDFGLARETDSGEAPASAEAASSSAGAAAAAGGAIILGYGAAHRGERDGDNAPDGDGASGQRGS